MAGTAPAPDAGAEPGVFLWPDRAAGGEQPVVRQPARGARRSDSGDRTGAAAVAAAGHAEGQRPGACLDLLCGEYLFHQGRVGGVRPGPGAVWLGRGDGKPGLVRQRAAVCALEVPV